ncbi:MAG TPA: FtsX-like permease family protein [Candidatus Limiplasma sp.]|nr:FtsX-like permease family protein [Candidatus Limiplasma sp.]HRX07851.1 FtsX-like permease family protein [Candidatus Limiplasma sp.]
MKTALKIAWRFLTHAKGQSILIAVGIAVGVSVQVFIGSLIAGLQAELVDNAIGRSSQITVTSAQRGELIDGYQAIVSSIEQAQPDALYVSPVVDASGFLRAGDGSDFPILLRGLNIRQADQIYRFSESLVSGTLPGDGEVLIGVDLAREASVADTVTLATPRGSTKEASVSGVFDLGVASLNERWIVSNLAFAQDMFGYAGQATAIEMQLRDPFQADLIAPGLAGILPDTLKVTDWKTQNAQLLSGLNGQSVSSLMIQVFVLLSVVLAIASVLAISVLQKSRQLGILKAMGIKNRDASLVFLFEGFFLGIAGAALGVLLGLGLSYAFTKFALNPDGTPVVSLLIDPNFITISAVIAVVSATLASLIPARRSARLDPMEVIRNG